LKCGARPRRRYVYPPCRTLHRAASFRFKMRAAFPIRWQFDWRLDSANQRLAVALAISLALHAALYGAWRIAPATAAFFKDVYEQLVAKPRAELKPQLEEPPPPKREVPLVFVEVDPALASVEPPKETKNYSTDHSIAANPEPKKADVPKIEGTQTHVVRTVESPKPEPKPLQPKPPEPAPVETKNIEPEVKPKATPPPGDLAMAKPPPKAVELIPVKEGDKPEPKPRDKPRTLADARARNPATAGEKTQQDGGVEHRAHIAMVDARRSPFGDYDSVFISMVQACWYQSLDENKYMLDRRGKVALTFRLHYDGRISQLEVAENTVGDMLSLLCQRAVLKPAPFPKWPREMRQMVGSDYREVKFTFYYD
jgi:hypothetical protein